MAVARWGVRAARHSVRRDADSEGRFAARADPAGDHRGSPRRTGGHDQFLGAASQTTKKSTGTPDPEPSRRAIPSGPLATLRSRRAIRRQISVRSRPRYSGSPTTSNSWTTQLKRAEGKAGCPEGMEYARARRQRQSRGSRPSWDRPLLKEQDPDGAKTWYQRAYSLNPRIGVAADPRRHQLRPLG